MALGSPRGCRGVGGIRGCRGVRCVLGGRECRYSEARRVKVSYGGTGGLLGGVGSHLDASGVYCGAGREHRYSGARRGIGGIRGHWGFLGGVWGC